MARACTQQGPEDHEPDLIDDFIREVSPAKPELCERVLRIILRHACPLDGDTPPRIWIGNGAMNVYTEVYTKGSGIGHSLQVLSRFFRWMAMSGRLDTWDAALCIAECEMVRRSYRMPPLTVRFPKTADATPSEMAVHFATMYELPRIERFVADMTDREAEATVTAIGLASTWLAERSGAPLVWARFDPEAYVADLIEQGTNGQTDRPPELVRQFNAELLGNLARYLTYLSPWTAPPEIAERVAQLALALRCGAAA